MVRTWSTSQVPASQRADYFAAALSEAIVPYGIENAEPESFSAEVSAACLGEVGLVKARGSAHICFRGPAQLARSSGHSFSLLMSTRNSWTATHRGTTKLAPRDILVVDSQFPFRAEVETGFEAIGISVSEDWLRRWVPDPLVVAARCIPGDSLWGAALSAYVSALTPELTMAPPLPLAVMADQLGSLLALSASRSFPVVTKASVKATRSLKERICDCIRQRCTEPQLCAAEVASALNVSARTLHRALASSTDTFGGLLIEARTQIAMRMLQSPAFGRLTISEIGYRAGFVSASHFAQTIRTRSGQTPRQVRTAHAR